MTDAEIRERLESSPALKTLHNQLRDEVAFRMEPSIQFDPMTILTIISIIIQVISYCRQHNSESEVRADMRDLRALPVVRTLRLRRKLHNLWRRTCPDYRDQDINPLLDAVYELSDSADDAAIDELIWLADRNRGAAN